MDDYQLAHAYETVNLHRRGGAAKIELNRPESRNAWNNQFSADLLAALRAVSEDPGVRADPSITWARAARSPAARTSRRAWPMAPGPARPTCTAG